MRRMMSDWNVELIDDSVSDFEVIFKGPKESKSITQFPHRSQLIGVTS